MLTTKQLQEISDWRSSWATTSGRKISIKGCKSEEEVISLAIDKAHAPSVLRALKTGGKSTKLPRAKAKELLKKEISKVLHTSMSQSQFDDWNEKLCTEIRNIYQNAGISDYAFGNAQKLVNMAVKYILSADIIDPNLEWFGVVHIPVDSIIMKVAQRKLDVSPLSTSWSITDDYKEFLKYQSRLRIALQSDDGFPLFWEIKNW